MSEQRTHTLTFSSLAGLLLAAWLAAALLTYDPADPPASSVYPANATAHNLCGPVGAWVAHGLFEGFGLGAFYVVISLAVVAGTLLRSGPVSRPAMRGAAWLASLVGLTTLASLALGGLTSGPVIGAGGYLGATGRALGQMHLGPWSMYLAVLGTIVIGLLLATGSTGVRTATQTMRLVSTLPPRAMGRLLALRGVAAESEDETDEDAGDGPRVRVKAAKKSRAAELDEELDEDEVASADEDSEEDEDELDAVPSKGASIPPAVRGRELLIKKPVKRDERQEMMSQLDAASRRRSEATDYELPSLDMLMETEPVGGEEQEKEVRRKAKVLEKTFANFGFNVKVVEIETGPVIAQYEIELEAGLRLSKITSLADDVAIALRVPSVRIVAPIPGKNTVGIEVPNEERQLVRLREVIEEADSKAQKMKIPIYLGKDVAGNPLVADLTTLPHLLIAGRTGTGKSVCLNTLIVSMLMTRRPDEVRMLLIDPKMVELSPYKTLPHLMHPVVTDMRKAEAILAWAVEKMEERYALLARAGVRHIANYNQLGEEELMDRLQPENDEERQNIPTHLPYIVIVADEMADLMMTSAKEVETHIIRLAQKSRAVGIHLVLATQKPTVDVITGLIKSNLPARIAFQVASRTDSRVVLDEMGADKLLGNGDMLFLWPGTSTLLRGQGTYVSDEEITRIVDFVGTTEPQFVKELVALKPTVAAGEGGADRFKNRDELYESAIEIIVREGRGSVSLLQRALGIGYGRGARLIDFMAEDGIVGAYNGSQAREVLITLEQWEEMSGGGGESTAAPAAPAKRRSNKIRPEPAEYEEEAVDEDEYVDEEEAEEELSDGTDEDDDEADYEDSEDEYHTERA